MINNQTSKTTQNISLASSFGLATVYGDTTFVRNVVKPDKSNTNKKSKKHSVYDDIKDYIANPESGTTIVFFTDGTKEVAKTDEFDRDNYDVEKGVLLCVARHLGFGYDDLEKTIYHKDREQNAENERRKKEEEKDAIRRKREKNAKRKAKRRSPIVLNNFVAHCDHDDDVDVASSEDNSHDTDKHNTWWISEKSIKKDELLKAGVTAYITATDSELKDVGVSDLHQHDVVTVENYRLENGVLIYIVRKDKDKYTWEVPSTFILPMRQTRKSIKKEDDKN